MRETEDGIGFDGQELLPEDLAGMIPCGVRILLTADRFCEYPKLIRHRQEKGGEYRVRLKGNLTLSHYGGELAVDDVPALGLTGIEDADLCGSGVATTSGALHREPWLIVLNGKPAPGKVPDYGMRWSLEALFL